MSAALAARSPDRLLLDTGPLLALVNRRDRHHRWARDLLGTHRGALLTCEAVVSEAWFLAQSRLRTPVHLLDLLERLPLDVAPAWGPRALELVRGYQDRPMDVADACLVALAERHPGCAIATIDRSDFSVYRMHGREAVPTVMPPA